VHVDTAINNLSLCSGGGGLDIGLELVLPTFRTVCWVEWEAFAIDFLATRMEESCLSPAPIWTDLRTFNGKPWCGTVDCLTAGYPCQPFSTAGKRGGADDPRHLWPSVYRVIGETQPSFVLLENVSGHTSLGAEQVIADLQGMDYETAAGLFTAAEVRYCQ
jgi:DNA (cytosine-5)-methyltransferase 1